MIRLAWRVFWLWYTKPSREKRYRLCLKNIDRLERELFPLWFKTKYDWSKHKVDAERALLYQPGAVWLVDDPRRVVPLYASSASSVAVTRLA